MGLRGGIDLGGTKIQAVVLGEGCEVLGQARRPTPRSGGPPAVAGELAAALRLAAGAAGVEPGSLAGVGVGSPGSVDSAAGTIARARNLPDWEAAFPLAAVLSQELGVPVRVGNDVQLAVTAEVEFGAARDYGSTLGVFWGTGVGGGIVVAGTTWRGRGAAGEIGHTVVRLRGALCACGRRGCLEAYAGRGSLEQRARRAVARGVRTCLFEIMAREGRDRLTSGVWEKALAAEDVLAGRLLDRAVAALGAGVASAVNLLDVEAVMIGGGLGCRLGEPYVRRIEQAMRAHLFVADRPPAVHLVALGDLGGAIGAALLVG